MCIKWGGGGGGTAPLGYGNRYYRHPYIPELLPPPPVPTDPGLPVVSMAKYREKSGCQLQDIRINYTRLTMGTCSNNTSYHIHIFLYISWNLFNRKSVNNDRNLYRSEQYIGIFIDYGIIYIGIFIGQNSI